MNTQSSEFLHTSLHGMWVLNGFFDIEHKQLNITNPAVDTFLGSVLSIWEKPSFLSLMMHPDDMPRWDSALLQWQSDLTFPDILSLRLLDNTGHYHDLWISLYEEQATSLDVNRLPVQFSFAAIKQNKCHINFSSQYGNDDEIEWVAGLSTQDSVVSALKQEHERANHYLDIAGVIMVTLDLDGNVTLLNRFACELLDINQKDALGLNWFDNFLPVGGRCIAQSAYNRLMSSEKIVE